MIDCKFCNKKLTEQRYYLTHLETHKEDNELLDKIYKETERIKGNKYKPFECSKCSKSFATSKYLRNHMAKFCKGIDEEKILELVKGSDDIKYMKKLQTLVNEKVQKLEANIINGDVNGQNNNVQFNDQSHNNRNNNINIKNDYKIEINNFGEQRENIQYLAEHENFERLIPHMEKILDYVNDEIENDKKPTRFNSAIRMKILTGITHGIRDLCIELYKLIHCHEDHPENHNIYITNLKKEILFFIYVNNRWERSGNMNTLKNEIENVFTALINSLDHYITMAEADGGDVEDFKEIKRRVIDLYNQNNKQFNENLKKSFYDVTYQNKEIIGDTYQNTVKKRLSLSRRPIR